MSLRCDRRGVSVANDLAERAAAIADGVARLPGASDRLDLLEARADALAVEGGPDAEIRRAAAIEFLASAVASLAIDGAWAPGEARAAVTGAAERLDMAPGAALLAVFLRALGNSAVAQLPPFGVVELYLWLLVELGPAAAASLWIGREHGRVDCLASAGLAPTSRRFRAAAASVLHGRPASSPQVHAVPVERWDRNVAALAARSSTGAAGRLQIWIQECAAALTPVLERETLFERNARRERELSSGPERQLVRLGYDLHDGPLQELVALNDELRRVRSHVGELVDEAHRRRIACHFDDLHARVAELDRGLRQLARSMRPTNALERPLEETLQNELDLLEHSSSIRTELTVTGTPSALTDSQKIVLYRVVQESLANVRKHSTATWVELTLRVKPGYVELSICDNGRGFDLADTVRRALKSNRLGLAGLEERVSLLGGTLRIEARIGEGVSVRVSLPRWRPLERDAATHYAAAAAPAPALR